MRRSIDPQVPDAARPSRSLVLHIAVSISQHSTPVHLEKTDYMRVARPEILTTPASSSNLPDTPQGRWKASTDPPDDHLPSFLALGPEDRQLGLEELKLENLHRELCWGRLRRND